MLASSWDRPRRRTASLSPPTSRPVVVMVGLGSELLLLQLLLLLLRLMLTRTPYSTRTCVLAPIRARPAVSGVGLDRTMPYRTWTLNQSNRYLLCSSARACRVFDALQLMPGRHTCTVYRLVHTDARISLYSRRWSWFSPRHK